MSLPLPSPGLDTNEGFVDSFASEWNSVPFMTQADATGTVFTKVPPSAFPIDSKGGTIFTRDAQAHSVGAIADRLSAWMAGRGAMPLDFDGGAERPRQGGFRILARSTIHLLLHDLDVGHGGSGRGADLAFVARAACLDFAPDLSGSA